MAIMDKIIYTGILGVGAAIFGRIVRIGKIELMQIETIQKETDKSYELLGELQKKLELGDQSWRRSFK